MNGPIRLLIAHARPEGFFSNVATVIGVLHEAERQRATPVVKFERGLYLDPSVGPNWWEYYFEPVSEKGTVPDCSADFTIGDTLQRFSDGEMARLAGAPWYLGLERASELVAKYIRPRAEIVAEVERFFATHLQGVYVVGVHIRGTDKQLETGVRLDDALILRTINAALSGLRVPFKILAASDESHFITLLRNAYGDRVVSYDAIRSDDPGTPLHRSGQFSAARIGRDAVIECLLLAKADYLIGSRSNLSVIAHCFHPEMAYVCLNDAADAFNRAPSRARHVRGLRYPAGAPRGPVLAGQRRERLSELSRCPVRRSDADAEQIVILPYYAAHELAVYQRLARLWRRLPTGPVRYRFLVSARFDAPDPPPELLDELSQLAPADFYRCPSRQTWFPESASAMFYDTLEHIFRTAAIDGGFALWLEPDIVPLRPNWLKDLETEWRSGHYTAMGTVIETSWIRKHINGGACYAKDFVRVVPRTGGGWDVSSFPHVARFGFYRDTKLIAFDYKSPTLAAPPAPRLALFHGVKDTSVFEYVERAV